MQSSSANLRATISKHPNKERNCNRGREEQALVRPAVEEEGQADSHPRRVADSLFFLDAGKSTEHQSAAENRNGATPVAVCPVAERSQAEHSHQAAP